MSALFNFQSLMVVVLLFICTCAYVHAQLPSLINKDKAGVAGVLGKAALIGECLSPYVGVVCLIMGINQLFQ